MSARVLSTWCESFQRHQEWRTVPALDSLLAASRELAFQSIQDHSGLPLCHTGKPRQMVNLDSLSLRAHLCVWAQSPQDQWNKAGDSWVVCCVRKTNTCQQTIRIRALSFVNKLWFFTKSWQCIGLCSISYPCNSFYQYSYLLRQTCFLFSLVSPQNLEYLENRKYNLYFFWILKPQLCKHNR